MSPNLRDQLSEFYKQKTPGGSTLSLSKVEFSPNFKSSDTTKIKIGITSGIHGDELNGTYICALLVQSLKKILYQEQSALLNAEIKILPALNPLGLNNSVRFWPFDLTDINRMFPGYPRGETSQRIASAIFSELSGTTHLVDIHSSNLFVREIPQVRLYHWDNEILNLAYEFGLPILWLKEITTMEKVHLPQTLSENGTKSFVLQVGQALAIDAKLCENIVFGILQWMVKLNALQFKNKDGLEKYRITGSSLKESSKVILANRSNTLSLTAECAGLFVLSEPTLNHSLCGKELAKGEEIGAILDPICGEVKEKICSPVVGELFTVRIHPIVYQGSLLARIVSKKELPTSLLKDSHPEQPQ